ncbi:DUF1120 domain-containing protein [Enterobacter sp. KBR-315C3_2022]|jgi:Protein of unknown function (DUF1120).|uniref:DUF1120 domain-containing protein n=1 Tax=Enterobacter sp. KBR-315C3_2022 TaxID=3242494 RepID=UPI003528ACA6
MKKHLLAAVLSLTATAVYADPTAMLKVQGSLTTAGCVPELTNGGLANFGEVGLDSLSSAVPYQAGHKNMTLTIKCQSATRVGWAINDDRPDSNLGAKTLASEFYIENGTANGVRATGAMMSGVGKTSAGERIGGYAVSTDISSVTADGAPVQAIGSTLYKGGVISSKSWINMWATGILYNNGTDVMSVSALGERAPLAFTTASFPLKIALAIGPSKNLTLTDKTELDGQSTITLVYL